MTVEVKASLLRGSVFVAGEQVECQIEFKNLDSENNAEMLAWASAQIICQCTVTEARLKKLVARRASVSDIGGGAGPTASGETSFVPSKGEQGFTVLSNKPTILFCNLLLRSSETKTCIYRDSIPFEAPPSFRGASIKYAYKVVVGIQRVTMATQLVRLPLRVLSVPGLTEAGVYQFSADEVAASNPFSDPAPDCGDAVLETALQIISGLTVNRQHSNYNISNARGFIVRFSLLKTAYKLGEDILGMFDFSQATVSCLQVTIALQSMETTPGCAEDQEPAPTVTTYNQEHISSLSIAHSPLSLHIPANVAPGFETDLVRLTWRLHFELVTLTARLDSPSCPAAPHDQVEHNHLYVEVNKMKLLKEKRQQLKAIRMIYPYTYIVYLWSPPETVDTETLVWTLPISVYPTNPTTLAGQGQPPVVRITC